MCGADEPGVVDLIYNQLYMLAIGIQMAGPNLTPASFEKGMFDYPRRTGPSGPGASVRTTTAPSDDARDPLEPGAASPFNRALRRLPGSQRRQAVPDRQVALGPAQGRGPVSASVGRIRAAALGAAGFLVAWGLGAVLLPKGMPVGVVLLGMVFGATTGLTSVGLILIWRANRVINFANLAIAGLAGALAVRSFLQWDVPYWLTLLAAPVIGLAVGASWRWPW
ncbi:MAG: hypothetical protein R2716_03045 [Microthrixaceae bacterium]